MYHYVGSRAKTSVSGFLASMAAFCVVAVISANSANASVIDWAFSYNGAGISGSGIITTGTTPTPGSTGVPAGGYNILQITGTQNSLAITGLVPQQSSGPTPWGDAHLNQVFVPPGVFIPMPGVTSITNSTYGYLVYFDNVLFPSNPQVDVSGILFTTASAQPNQLWNLYSDSGTYYLANVAVDYPAGSLGTPVNFSASPIPEPASFAILGAGLLGLGSLRHRKHV